MDRLDENWINDDVRYHVIRALLDTVRVFNNDIKSVKIIVAVREDLIFRVFKASRDPGCQEEKFRSIYLTVSWNAQQLETLIDRRINQLIEEQYSSQKVSLRQLLPPHVPLHKDKIDPLNYMVSRTMMRPRDLIVFFNECIRSAQDQPKISKDNLFRAEEGYSNSRVTALSDEWKADYPDLRRLVYCLKTFPHSFKQVEICDKFERNMLEFLGSGEVLLDMDSELYKKLEFHFNKNRLDLLFHEFIVVMY